MGRNTAPQATSTSLTRRSTLQPAANWSGRGFPTLTASSFGQFVRGRIVAGTLRNGISVPERAVQIASEEATVLLVARDNSVVRRTVEFGGQMGGQWVISSASSPVTG
jgi:multidrug efflux pump subunit AcrA (membrane-fusion protein)